MSDNSFEVIFICDAETEENEKVRHYYEGIQQLKEGRLPSSTQLFQAGRIFNKKLNPPLSLIGTRQLLNIKLKLEEGKLWTSSDGISVGHGPNRASVDTFDAIVPDHLKGESLSLQFICSKLKRIESIRQFREWASKTSAKRVVIFGSADYFVSLLGTPLVLRNCDVYRVSCSYIAEDSLSFSNIRMLYRSDFSTHFPLNTVLSWKHILYSNSANNTSSSSGLVSSASDASLSDGGDSTSIKSTISVGYAHGFSTSREDINPTCRICQVSYFEMPDRRLIKPCKCSGTVKYVHKDCLNTWRATSPYAHTTCSMCHYHYKIRSPLISKYLVNEDFTFVLAVLVMFPLCYLVGCVVYAAAFQAMKIVHGSGDDSLVWLSDFLLRRLSQLFLNSLSKLLISPLENLVINSVTVLQVSLLGCNLVGIAGFFATNNPYSLVSLSIVSYFALRFKALAVFCVIVGWGTALRELHLSLMMTFRQIISWLGNIIIESS